MQCESRATAAVRSPSSRKRARKRPQQARRRRRCLSGWPGSWRSWTARARRWASIARHLSRLQGDEALEAEIQLRLAGTVAETQTTGGVAWPTRSWPSREPLVWTTLRFDAGPCPCYGLLRVFGTGQGIPRKEMEQALALEQSLWSGRSTWRRPSSSFGFQLVWAEELIVLSDAHSRSGERALRGPAILPRRLTSCC